VEDVDKVTDEYQTCGQEMAHISETIEPNWIGGVDMIPRLRLTGMENKGNLCPAATHSDLAAKITSVCMGWIYTLDLQDKFTSC
jgi:hypothetical protein